MSGDILGYQNQDVDASGIQRVETRGAADHPITHRTAHNRVIRPRMLTAKVEKPSPTPDMY